jgi:ABC-type glycerol-3-phosphate transport system substrate-binding protein
MRKLLGLGVFALAVAALAAGAAQAGKTRQQVTNLTIATYVWQPTTVAAMKSIVDSWNKSNPEIQVSIVPVDVNSVHDKLLTTFVGGTASDIVHDEAADLAGFTQQGYLANLNPLLPKELKSSIPKGVWDSVRYGGKITGVPMMLQTYNVFANMDKFKAAGIKAPTVNAPWTWDRFRAVAKQLTSDGNYGVCWGLRSPVALVQTVSLNWGGQWNYLEKGRWVFKMGDGERTPLQTIHNMIYQDKSVDPAGVGLSGSGVLPAFFGGRCAMTVQGNFQVQGMIEQSPKGFNWAMFPPLKGQTQDQVANPQTLSISEQSQNKEEAMKFIAYALNTENMAKLARGDWLIPVSPVAATKVVKSTKRYGSWRNAISAVPYLKKGNWVQLVSYTRWKNEVAQAAMRGYFANQISYDELEKQLSDGWERLRNTP